MRTDKIFYKCGDCTETAIFKSYKAARGAGWSVSGDYKKCWCPKHAAAHRVGAAANVARPVALQSDSGIQLKIEI